MRRVLLTLLVVVSTASNARAQSVPTTAPASTPTPAVRSTPATLTIATPDAGERFTLPSAIAAMRTSHPLLASGRANVTAANRTAHAVGLWQNPQLDASYVTALRTDPRTPASYGAAGAASIGVTQFLELSGTPGARRRAAEREALATKADLQVTERALVIDVETAFVTLAAAVARRAVLGETVQDLERADQIVKARVTAGVAPRYDSSRIAIALADAQAAVGDAEGDILRARGDLNVAVGPGASALRGTPVFDFDAEMGLPPMPALLQVARDRRPDLAAAANRTRAAEEQISVAEKSVFPGLGLRLGAGYGQVTGQVDAQVGLVVPLPVVDRGQAAVPLARARAEAARYAGVALNTAVEQRIAAIYGEVLRRRESLTRYQNANRNLSAGMRSEAEAGYREARLSVLELVDAYQSLRDARLRMIDLASNTRLAEVALRGSVGVEALPPAQ